MTASIGSASRRSRRVTGMPRVSVSQRALASLPTRDRLSTTVISWLARLNCAAALQPMNPAPPVMTMRKWVSWDRRAPVGDRGAAASLVKRGVGRSVNRGANLVAGRARAILAPPPQATADHAFRLRLARIRQPAPGVRQEGGPAQAHARQPALQRRLQHPDAVFHAA